MTRVRTWLLWVAAAALTVACAGQMQAPAGTPQNETPVADRTLPLGVTTAPLLVERAVTPLPTSTPAQTVDAARIHVLLLNGGGRAATNQWSHVEHIVGMVDALTARGISPDRISIFSADGRAADSDVITRDVTGDTVAEQADLLLGGTRLEKDLGPRRRVEDTDWDTLLGAELGGRVQPARNEALRQWFATTGKAIPAGDTLLVYTTDHGIKGKQDLDNGALAMWNETLDVDGLRAMFAELGADVRLVTMMSQCYSGTFAAALLPEPGESLDGVQGCGVFSVPRDLPAFGCFPEGRARGTALGHGYALIDALQGHAGLDAAHRATLLSDMTPDVPVRTSDLALMRALDEAMGSAQWGDRDARIDELLVGTRDDARFADDWALIEATAASQGLDVPSSLAELERLDGELARDESELEGLRTYWKDIHGRLAERNLEGFLEARPEWGEKLELRSLNRLDADGVLARRAELVEALARTTQEGPLGVDLATFHRQSETAQTLWWHTTVRRAGVHRMRVQLERIAARALLADTTDAELVAHRELVDDLMTCEASAPGSFEGPSTPPSAVAMSTLAHDREVVAKLRPAHLGVSFEQADGFDAGAMRVSEVSSRSPAAVAGLAPGDVILGPAASPFGHRDDLQRWVLTAPRGESIEIVVVRDGERQTVSLTL